MKNIFKREEFLDATIKRIAEQIMGRYNPFIEFQNKYFSLKNNV